MLLGYQNCLFAGSCPTLLGGSDRAAQRRSRIQSSERDGHGLVVRLDSSAAAYGCGARMASSRCGRRRNLG